MKKPGKKTAARKTAARKKKPEQNKFLRRETLENINPGLQAVAWIALAAAILIAGFTPIKNNDLGMHIRLGATITEAGKAPTYDYHSYTAEGAEYLDHEWLPQIVLYHVDRLWGETGLVAFKGLLLFTAFALVAAAAGASPATALVLTACTVVAISRIQMRPHLIAWVLIGLLLIFLRYRQFLSITFLLALWANCHASFILALMISLIMLAELFYETREKKYLVWALAFLCAPMINPYGPKIYLFALQIREHVGFVSEWQKYPVDSGYLWIVVAYLGALWIDLLINRKNRLMDFARLILLSGLSWSAMRNGIVAMLYLAPLASMRLNIVLVKPDRVALKTAVAGLTYTANLIACFILINTADPFSFRLDRTALPVGATEFVEKANLSGNMFNDYNFGGYLLWKSWPDHRVFVDGRLEVYGQGRVLDDYLTVSNVRPNWLDIVARYNISYFIVRADREIAHALSAQQEWALVYFDYNAAVFVRENKFENIRRLRLLTPWANRDRTRIAESISEARYLISLNPMFYGAHKILAFLLFRQGDYAESAASLGHYLKLNPEGADVPETVELITKLRAKGATI